MNIYLLANLEHNPYLINLIQSLETKRIHVAGGEYNYQSIFFLPKIIKAGKIDIFHIHDVHYFLQGKSEQRHILFDNDTLRRNLKFIIFVAQIFILKLLGIKIIWTVHEWEDKYSQGRQAILPWWRQIFRTLFDGFIVHSHTLKTKLIQELNLDSTAQIAVIYHGHYIHNYPQEITPNQARQHLSIPNYKFVFLLFGNIYPSKGFINTIRIFQELDLDDTFLLLAGKPVNQQIDLQIHRLIQNWDNIRYVPQIVPDAEVQIYMQASNCVILPYQVFTTSGVAILAMSFAKPCIVPDSGYFQEVFDENGAFLFPPTHPTGLAVAMEKATRSFPNLAAMGTYNFQKVEKWNWESVAHTTEEFYRQYPLKKPIFAKNYFPFTNKIRSNSNYSD